jgi:enoyl-CoA hydratase
VSSPIRVEVADRIAVVTLDRPEARNALNREIRSTLPRVMLDVEADDGVDVVILTGADPAFTAGIDLKEFGGGASVSPRGAGPDMGERDAEGRLPFRGALPPHTKPVIGAINGVAITGGLELALSCDFLVASERARFADTHSRVGVQPGWGLTVMLCQSVGVRRAREMSATGNFVDARTALAWGLVNHVVAHDELLPFCRSLAADIVSNDQAGVRRILQTYDEVSRTTLEEGWAIEDRVSRDWEGGGFDPEKVEARRAGIVARGRSQL